MHRGDAGISDSVAMIPVNHVPTFADASDCTVMQAWKGLASRRSGSSCVCVCV